ncbi:MAG: TlpA family protein disulfide reductase [Candidatus Atribacteria bacterium]|nr:MAG: TlpA family protein disulfide reductase [Candidatus Atribacteria bacterium]
MRAWQSVMLAGLILLIGLHAWCSETQLRYISDITTLTTLCYPQGVKLESDPIDGIECPDVQDPSLHGVLHLGDGEHPICIEMGDEAVTLHVDVDGSGTLRPMDWERTLVDGSLLASVPFQIQYADEQTASYQAFLVWSPATPTVVTYCRNSYQSGEIELGGKAYRLAIVDEDSDGRYDDLDRGTLLLDTDRDGELLLMTDSHEIFSLAEPFNLEGVVYEVAAVSSDGSWMQVLKSEADVSPKLPLLAGFPAPMFEATDVKGEAFSLEAERGNVIVLDFWASWCSPCISELPTLEQIADEFSTYDMIVVGINRDRSEGSFHAAIKNYGINTRQIFDSDVGPVGDTYRISGYPMTYIIDRDGVIAARGLRGEALVAAVRGLIESEE